MKKIIFSFLLIANYCFGGGWVYDCFMFYNEIEVLKIRLNVLDEYVDRFVIVESVETQRGNPKEMYFAQNRHLFEKFLHKVIYVPNYTRTRESPWIIEGFQRDQIMRGLTGCNDLDIIIISDLDEIINPTALEEGIDRILNKNENIVVCEQDIHAFHLNRKDPVPGRIEYGSIITTFGFLKTKTPNYFRYKRHSFPRIKNGGWHFSSQGGVEQHMIKMHEYADDFPEELKNRSAIQELIDSRPICEIDESYPAYIRDNIPYFKDIGLIAE